MFSVGNTYSNSFLPSSPIGPTSIMDEAVPRGLCPLPVQKSVPYKTESRVMDR